MMPLLILTNVFIFFLSYISFERISLFFVVVLLKNNDLVLLNLTDWKPEIRSGNGAAKLAK